MTLKGPLVIWLPKQPGNSEASSAWTESSQQAWKRVDVNLRCMANSLFYGQLPFGEAAMGRSLATELMVPLASSTWGW